MSLGLVERIALHRHLAKAVSSGALPAAVFAQYQASAEAQATVEEQATALASAGLCIQTVKDANGCYCPMCDENGMVKTAPVPTPTPGGGHPFLQWLIQNLPSIIALIMSFFGGAPKPVGALKGDSSGDECAALKCDQADPRLALIDHFPESWGEPVSLKLPDGTARAAEEVAAALLPVVTQLLVTYMPPFFQPWISAVSAALAAQLAKVLTKAN